MPRATSKVGQVGDTAEPLLFAAGLDAIKNVVIDASLIPADSNFNDRRIWKAGTLLKRSTNVSPGGGAQYTKYDGTGQIEGVLALDIEVVDGTSNSDTARGMFYHGCVFRASKIVDYSTYGNQAISTLNTCKFENV
jgi:hypothetical protein